MQYYKKAISLLEILLALIIIASITMMAVRYFIITSRDAKITHAIRQVKTLTRASYAWLDAQRQADFSDKDGGTAVSTSALLEAQLIDSPQDTTDPWGGAIEVAPGSNPSYVKIELGQLPEKDCRNLTQQLKYINHAKEESNCHTGDQNIFIGEF